MKFLDLNGLTHFFGKVKTWAGNNYLSLKGGSIDGSVVINNEEAVALRVLDGSSYSNKEVDISPTRITMSYTDEDQGGGSSTVYNLDIQNGNITANSFTRIGGTATQVLIANGSVREIGSANGIAGLDANGNVPLAQLGNLDTTVAEVVTALPTTNIKKHIYLIKDTDIAQNQYEEYIYTGDTSATYDASKWEKLGDFRATVDLADYAKKSEAAQSVNANYATTSIFIKFIAVDGHDLSSLELFGASSNRAGLMIASDKNKLDGIANNANNYSLPTASSTTKGGITLGYSQSGKNYPVVLDGNGKAYVNVPWTDTNTTYDLSPYAKTADVNAALAKKVDVVSGKGLSTHDFTSAYKSKLDSIDTTYAKKIETVDLSNIRVDEKVISITQQGQILNQVILFSNFHSDNDNTTIEIAFKDATSNMSGFMSIRDKNKLDTIAFGATADSAITTAEIDALFA